MNPELKALESFFRKLAETEIPFMVGGSLSSSAHGHPRQTNDADIVLHLYKGQIEAFVRALENDFMVSRQSIEGALSSTDEYSSFQLIHNDSLARVDCFILGTDDYSQTEFSRRKLMQLLPGVLVPVATPEDTVLRKLLWFELGGRVSDRQWNDIVGVLEVQRGALDEGYLDTWADRLGVRPLLDEARLQAFD